MHTHTVPKITLHWVEAYKLAAKKDFGAWVLCLGDYPTTIPPENPEDNGRRRSADDMHKLHIKGASGAASKSAGGGAGAGGGPGGGCINLLHAIHRFMQPSRAPATYSYDA